MASSFTLSEFYQKNFKLLIKNNGKVRFYIKLPSIDMCDDNAVSIATFVATVVFTWDTAGLVRHCPTLSIFAACVGKTFKF